MLVYQRVYPIFRHTRIYHSLVKSKFCGLVSPLMVKSLFFWLEKVQGGTDFNPSPAYSSKLAPDFAARDVHRETTRKVPPKVSITWFRTNVPWMVYPIIIYYNPI